MNKKEDLKQKIKKIKWLQNLHNQVQKVKSVQTYEKLKKEKNIKEEEKRKRKIIIIIILILLLLLLFIKIIFIGNNPKIAKQNNGVSKVKNENTVFEKISKNAEIKISTENIIEEKENLENTDIQENDEKDLKENKNEKNNKINSNKNTYKGNNNINYENKNEENNIIQNEENLNKNENIKTDENTNEKNENVENNKNDSNENNNKLDEEQNNENENNENKAEQNTEQDTQQDTQQNTENDGNNTEDEKEETNNSGEQNNENEENTKLPEEDKKPIEQEEIKRKFYISGKVITENINNEHIANITLYKTNNINNDALLGEEIKTIKTNKDGTFKILIYEAKESEIIDLNDNNIPDEIEVIYNIKITKQSYLSHTIKGIKFNNNNEILQMSEYKILAGDVNNSNKIQLLDLSRVMSNSGIIITEENKEKIQDCDLNEDGIIDSLDIDILNKNYEETAKEEIWL